MQRGPRSIRKVFLRELAHFSYCNKETQENVFSLEHELCEAGSVSEYACSVTALICGIYKRRKGGRERGKEEGREGGIGGREQ